MRFRSLPVLLWLGQRRRQRRRGSSVCSKLDWVSALSSSASDRVLGATARWLRCVSPAFAAAKATVALQPLTWKRPRARSGETAHKSIVWTAWWWRHRCAARWRALPTAVGASDRRAVGVGVAKRLRLRAVTRGETQSITPRQVETSPRRAFRRRTGFCCFSLLRVWSPSNGGDGSSSVATSATLARLEAVRAARIASQVRRCRGPGRVLRGSMNRRARSLQAGTRVGPRALASVSVGGGAYRDGQWPPERGRGRSRPVPDPRARPALRTLGASPVFGSSRAGGEPRRSPGSCDLELVSSSRCRRGRERSRCVPRWQQRGRTRSKSYQRRVLPGTGARRGAFLFASRELQPSRTRVPVATPAGSAATVPDDRETRSHREATREWRQTDAVGPGPARVGVPKRVATQGIRGNPATRRRARSRCQRIPISLALFRPVR